MFPLLKRTLSLSLQRVGWSFGPSLVAALPLVLVLMFLDLDIQSGLAADNLSSYSHPTENVLDVNQVESVAAETATGGAALAHDLQTSQESELVGSPDCLGFGPSWMRSWIFVFMVISTASALTYRQAAAVI